MSGATVIMARTYPIWIRAILKTGSSTTPMCFGRSVKLAVKTCTFDGGPIGQLFSAGSLWREFSMA
jgi:hypothetical protein